MGVGGSATHFLGQRFLFLLGAPAAGKGSYGALVRDILCKRGISAELITMSAVIRAEIAEGTEAGQHMRPYLAANAHAPTALVCDTLFKRIFRRQAAGTSPSYSSSSSPDDPGAAVLSGRRRACTLLDGFPRNAEQAQVFLERMEAAAAAAAEKEPVDKADGALSSTTAKHWGGWGALHLRIRRDWARKKAGGRLLCPNPGCGEG